MSCSYLSYKPVKPNSTCTLDTVKASTTTRGINEERLSFAILTKRKWEIAQIRIYRIDPCYRKSLENCRSVWNIINNLGNSTKLSIIAKNFYII